MSDVVAEDANKQAALWRVAEDDTAFRVVFGDTWSDADLAVVGREEDLLSVLTDLAHRGLRYHVDTRTEADAERLDGVYGEGGSGDYLMAHVEHDESGDWNPAGDAE